LAKGKNKNDDTWGFDPAFLSEPPDGPPLTDVHHDAFVEFTFVSSPPSGGITTPPQSFPASSSSHTVVSSTLVVPETKQSSSAASSSSTITPMIDERIGSITMPWEDFGGDGLPEDIYEYGPYVLDQPLTTVRSSTIINLLADLASGKVAHD
jgi:hypothetical protein